ncbi:MAG: NAD(P)/FAD-dependent oxidoreductase [Gemmataceae bacterium]|nr:NAD(P)/FAD-dependent oxidoreductase [Gemmataceae bacterium]
MASPEPRRRVLIVGGGFGGLLCAQNLAKAPVDVTLVDRRNFHLFQPLLYQVATGALSPANIAAPLRSILKRQRNVKTLLGEVVGFDGEAKEAILSDGSRLGYDVLVLATGSTHHYFGKDAQWEPLAPGLKTIEDATRIRQKVLSAFEHAEQINDPALRKKLMTFAVVGGGPTGVEMAGSIAELASHTLRRDFRSIDPSSARVVLIENSDRVLQVFPEKLSRKALEALHSLRVETWLNCRVTDVTPESVVVDRQGQREELPTETVIWAAGVKASPLGKLLAEAMGGGEVDRGGRIVTTRDCTVPNHPDVFVIGDLAHYPLADGKTLPGVAPVAMQQGQYVGEAIARRASGLSSKGPFRYRDKGIMATIGRSMAVAQTGKLQLSGWLAWAAWLFVHIMYLAVFENRVLVLFQWFWNYITRNRSARLITWTDGR